VLCNATTTNNRKKLETKHDKIAVSQHKFIISKSASTHTTTHTTTHTAIHAATHAATYTAAGRR
jgi:hypothetical protein